MFNSVRVACAAMLVSFMAAAPCAQAQLTDAFLIGAWARSQGACAHPELTFGKSTLDIALDADGQPASFAFPAISYQLGAEHIAVNLGRLHPYGKTLDKKSLLFKRIDQDTIALRKLRGGNTQFIRCATV